VIFLAGGVFLSWNLLFYIGINEQLKEGNTPTGFLVEKLDQGHHINQS